ncbi:MAG: glycosyltransferase family 2 protein [Candidatus Korobacteraceae bacterium]|jgi:glycosyltransferase involved in cell wall biosynthesis
METHQAESRDSSIAVTFIVPALNEQDNLPPLIGRLMALDEESRPCEVLIVDDASTDATYECGLRLAGKDPRIRILHKEQPRGLGHAIRHALPHARGKVAVVVMADGVDPLETAVPQFCNKVLIEGCHLVLLSRYTAPSDSDSIPFSYKFFQSGFRLLTRYGLGIPFPDTTYAFRAFDAHFVRKLGLKSGGFEISPEITFKVVLAGGKVGEVSGRQTRRLRGKSKFRFLRAFSGYSRVVREAFYLRLRGTRNRVV